MNAHRSGIIASLAIHAVLLSLVFMIPGREVIPIKTFHIAFEQRESASREMPMTKSSAKRMGTAHVQNSRQGIAPAKPQLIDQTNKIVTDQKSVMPTAQDGDVISLTGTGLPGRAAAGIPGPENKGSEPVMETGFGYSGAPSFLRREMPVYPKIARRLGKEGRVVLRLLIDMNGQLQDVEVIEGADYGFTEAAVEAVKKSIYAPARRNGRTVTSKAILQVRFNLK